MVLLLTYTLYEPLNACRLNPYVVKNKICFWDTTCNKKFYFARISYRLVESEALQ